MKIKLLFTVISLGLLASAFFLFVVKNNHSLNYVGYFIDDQGKPTGVSKDTFDQFSFEYLRDLRFDEERNITTRGSTIQSYSLNGDVGEIYKIDSSFEDYRCNSKQLFIIDMGELYATYRYLGFIREPNLSVDEKYSWYKSVRGNYIANYNWSTGSDLTSLCLGIKDIKDVLKDQYIMRGIDKREFVKNLVEQTILSQEERIIYKLNSQY